METPKGIQLHLPDAVGEKLKKATANSFWTIDSLVEQWVNENLHAAYAAVTYRTVEIAPSGTYRAFDTKASHPALTLTTATGRFRISVQPENPNFLKWVRTYRTRGKTDPEAEAREMCLFQLRTYLEEWTGQGKIIYPDDFLVEQIARPSSA
jgi:hypothetical protein